LGPQLPQLFGGGAVGENFRIDPGFTDATGNQLRVLGAKVENDDHLALHLEGEPEKTYPGPDEK
jgi:hypothetical protein